MFPWVPMVKEGMISALLWLNTGSKIQSGRDTVYCLISCVFVCLYLHDARVYKPKKEEASH